MGTTFTGRGAQRTSNESARVDPLDVFIARIRSLGATDADVADLREAWPEATDEQRFRALRSSDADLRAVLSENDEPAPVDEPSPVAVGLAPVAGGEQSEGASTAPPASDSAVPDDTVPNVLAWVGDDIDRAHAAIDVELSRDEPRSTLLDPLTKLVEADGEPDS